LGLGIVSLQWMRITMRGGQMCVAGWAGPFSDRFGNRPMMILCQAVVASSMGFFLLATPRHPLWLFGAFIAWSFYAGLNIGLPNLMLRLSPEGQQQDNSGYISLYFATSGACYAASSVLGGWLFDLLKTEGSFWIGPYLVTHYQILFAAGLFVRSLALVWLLLLIEPGALTLADIARRYKGRRN
jgi:MFS family permease